MRRTHRSYTRIPFVTALALIFCYSVPTVIDFASAMQRCDSDPAILAQEQVCLDSARHVVLQAECSGNEILELTEFHWRSLSSARDDIPQRGLYVIPHGAELGNYMFASDTDQDGQPLSKDATPVIYDDALGSILLFSAEDAFQVENYDGTALYSDCLLESS